MFAWTAPASAFVFGYAGSVRVAGTVGRRGAAAESTGKYSRRVPAARSGPATPGNAANRSRMPASARRRVRSHCQHPSAGRRALPYRQADTNAWLHGTNA
jgi:hypothetical protein